MITYASSAAMRAACDAEPHLIFYVYELTLPNGSMHLADAHVNSLTGGQYADVDADFGSITRGFLDMDNKLLSNPWIVTFRDYPDRAFARYVGGIYGARIQGSSALLLMGHRRVARADWDVRASGVVRTVEMIAANQWRLTHRYRDEELMREYPFVFNRAFVSSAATSGVIGEPPHKLYGKLNSQGLGDNGFVKLQCIDITAGVYAVAQDVIKSIDRVYTGEERLPTTLTWSREDIVITGGITLTTVRFTGALPEGDVFADVQGYTDDGTTSGNLITNEVEMLEHYLTTYGGYTGEFHAENTVTAAYFDDHAAQYGRGRMITGKKTALQQINEWAESLEVKVCWGADGKLMFFVFDPADLTNDPEIARNTVPSTHLDVLRHAIASSPDNPCEYLHENVNQSDVLLVDYVFTSDGPQANMIVSDPLVEANISKDIQATWSPNYVV